MVDYLEHFASKKLTKLAGSTDTEQKIPGIPITIIEWLQVVYPIKRYQSPLPSEFDLGRDEGHLEVIDRLLQEYHRQNDMGE
jgi:hypothetical protein